MGSRFRGSLQPQYRAMRAREASPERRRGGTVDCCDCPATAGESEFGWRHPELAELRDVGRGTKAPGRELVFLHRASTPCPEFRFTPELAHSLALNRDI